MPDAWLKTGRLDWFEMNHTADFVVRHGYLLLFLWLLVEQGALPLPSIPLLLACGALVRSGQLHPVLVVASGMAACLIADNVWFQLGRRRGARILHFLCRIALEPDSCVRQTENAFLKYGPRSLLVSKFVPGLNTVAAPLAGSAGTSLGRFLLFDTAGALVWMLSYLCLGYVFSGQIEMVGAYATRMGSGALGLLGAAAAAWIVWKYIQRRRFLRKLAVARITPEELRRKLDAGEDVLVIDLRSVRESAADAIPGALRIAVEDLAERHGDIPRDRDVVLFCS
jgi:membrane protein DedA with SNARE-associated domain